MNDEQRRALAQWVLVAAEQARDAANKLKASDAPEAFVALRWSVATLKRAQDCLHEALRESSTLKLHG